MYATHDRHSELTFYNFSFSSRLSNSEISQFEVCILVSMWPNIQNLAIVGKKKNAIKLIPQINSAYTPMNFQSRPRGKKRGRALGEAEDERNQKNLLLGKKTQSSFKEINQGIMGKCTRGEQIQLARQPSYTITRVLGRFSEIYSRKGWSNLGFTSRTPGTWSTLVQEKLPR